MVVLGIDIGGTKSVCLAADGTGAIVAEARGPGANLHANGPRAVERVLRQVAGEAGRARDERPAAICLGMAGVDRPRDAEAVRAILARLDSTARLLVVNDALIALEAAVGDGPGVVIVSGTGSIAYGRGNTGRAARAGGWGYVLGDEGSGYWLGRLALRAVVRAADGRGPATSLTERVLAQYQVARPQDLVNEIYGDVTPATIAPLASIVSAAADEGDAVARRLVEAGARELAEAGISVATRLDLATGPIVLGGGIFRAVPSLASGVTAEVGRALPRARVEPLTEEPAAGAVRLALALARDRVSVPAYVDDAAS
jgi:N-acetylglucosamine kinase-like BadF-type ATPase